MMDPASADRTRLEEMFDSFGKAWLKYWESYVILQNQLYETLRAGRDLQWLAATDSGKLGEINRLTEGSNGKLDVADYQRTVKTLMTGGSDPVISKEPTGAYTTVITDKALGK